MFRLRRWSLSAAKFPSTAGIGAPIRKPTTARGPIHFAHGSKKESKRRDLQLALKRDRERAVLAMQEPIWTQLKAFPWKMLVSFMCFWTWFGYWCIPKIKRWQARNSPELPKHMRDALSEDPPPLSELMSKEQMKKRQILHEKNKAYYKKLYQEHQHHSQEIKEQQQQQPASGDSTA